MTEEYAWTKQDSNSHPLLRALICYVYTARVLCLVLLLLQHSYRISCFIQKRTKQLPAIFCQFFSMLSSLFWNITQKLLLTSCLCLPWFTLQHWRYRRHITVKRRLTFSELHSYIPEDKTTAVRTSSPTILWHAHIWLPSVLTVQRANLHNIVGVSSIS
jgi:uncharacterized membrane protein YjgN (DUF898 family)